MFFFGRLLLFPSEVWLFLACYLTLRMEALRSSEIYQTTRRHIPEANAVLRCRYEDLKSDEMHYLPLTYGIWLARLILDLIILVMFFWR
jgi:hypothetical protein